MLGMPFWWAGQMYVLGEDLHEGRPTTSMKKGWLCRTSYDKKNHEIAPVLIQIKWWSRSSSDDLDRVMIQIHSSDVDPDREMIQIQWWCSMMIQIERWSRSDNDLKMKMTWRQRWLEDEDDLKMRWSSWYREENQCWKIVSKEYLPS